MKKFPVTRIFGRHILLAVGILFSESAVSQTGWDELGINAQVTASYYTPTDINAFFSDGTGNIYIGLGKGVYKWNGNSLIELGSGDKILNANAQINALTGDSFGNIYAAGSFTNSSNRYVAKWDGSSWSELGAGTGALNATANILSLAADLQGNVYAAGEFKNSNSKYYVAKWNKAGNAWTELGAEGFSLNAGNIINSILCDKSGNIYAAGLFKNGNGKCYVAKWNGLIWTEVAGTNFLNANNTIIKIALDSFNNLYAAGRFTGSNGCYVAKFDGISWSEVGSGAAALNADAAIYSLALDNSGNIFVGGSFENDAGSKYVSKWNGTNWNEVQSPVSAFHPENQIKALITDPSGNLYASGGGDHITNYASVWNGTKWADLGPNGVLNAAGLTEVVTDSAGAIYVGGSFSRQPLGQVAKWNGIEWELVGALNANNFLTTLKSYRNKLYAIGHFINQLGKPFVAEWNGVKWNETGNLAASAYSNIQISNVALDYDGAIYVSEQFAGSGYGVLKWTGSEWLQLVNQTSIPPFGNVFAIVADADNDIYLAGDFGSGINKYLPKWNGANWEHVGESTFSIINNTVYTLAIDLGGNIYIGGIFSDENNRYFVAKWTKATDSWAKLGDFSVNDPIRSIVCDTKGNVYVAGDFTANGRNYVAKWNGLAWSEVGIGANGLYGSYRVNYLSVDKNNNLYATGQFVNTRGFSYVARYKLENTSGCSLSIGPDTSINVQCRTCTADLTTLYNLSQYTNVVWNTSDPKKALPGKYNFIVRDDAANCTDTVYISVNIAVNDSISVCPQGNVSIAANLNGISYQWQVDRGNGYSDLNNDQTYSQTSNKILQITNIASTNYNNKYRCKVDGINSSETIVKFASFWTGRIDNNWENPSNWGCNTIPDGNTDVYIPKGNVKLNSNAACRSISIDPNALFTVSTGANLNISH